METKQKPLIALAISLALFSCTSNEPVASNSETNAVSSSYEVVGVAALPTTITSYIASKYAGSTTTEVNLLSNGTYVAYVNLAAGSTAKTSSSAKTSKVIAKLSFTAKGTLTATKTQTPVLVADLLPAITTYTKHIYKIVQFA